MDDPRDLTGVWYGRYVGDLGEQENSFIAVLEDAGGALSGSITEPAPEISAGIRRAIVSGSRGGSALRFTKQYISGRWNHAVAYHGQVDDQGTTVTGRWQVDWLRGSFVMEREKFSAEELEEEEEIEVELPVR